MNWLFVVGEEQENISSLLVGEKESGELGARGEKWR